MRVEFELTPEQMDELASRVAAMLSSGEEPGESLTVAEAARRVAVSERTIRRAVATGRLESVRPCGVRAIRIPAAALDGWVSAARTPAARRARRRQPGRKVLRDALEA